MYKSKSEKSPYNKIKKQNVTPSRTKQDIICSQIKPDTSSKDEPFEEYHPAEGLFEEEMDIEGKYVFQVKGKSTPKARKSLCENTEKLSILKDTGSAKVREKTKGLTPRSLKCKMQGLLEEEKSTGGKEATKGKITPKAKKSLFGSMERLSISKGTGSPKTAERTGEQTPRSLRLRMKQELAGLKSDTADSDPEDSDNASGDDFESGSDEDVLSAAVCDDPKGRSKWTFSEAYFTAQKQKKSVTSNKTLSNVKLQRTNIQELSEILMKTSEHHKQEKELLFKKYCSQFNRWDSLLGAGFNVLLHGVGSKQKVLKAFCEKCLNDALHVVIYGFCPSLTLKQILCTITEDALDYDGKFSSIQDHCDYIKGYFMEHDLDLFVVIHSIDGLALRSVRTQSILSALATIPNIHFICSMDHINAPLLWDQIMLSQFKWVWFDVTTYEPYILETSYENSLLRDQSSHLVLSSLLHVYNSLTPNNRGVFLILAKHQKEEQKKSSNSGMTFYEWYQECREAFLVNSEITMQAQLSEFKNHKLLSSRKNADGIELWYIPVDSATLDQFLESCE